MSLNLHHLAVFDAVAVAGSVTGGAKRMLVSQPAVSKQVRALERAVRVPLLERHGRSVSLTEAGRVLATYARSIFNLADEAEAAVADVGALRRGTLRVGATPTLGTYLLPDALVYFRQRFPGIHVDVATASSAVLAGWVAAGALDLAIGDETLVAAGLERKKLMAAQFVTIAPPGHPLTRKRRPTTLAEIATEPLVVREAGSTERVLVEQYLAAAGVAVGKPLTLGSTEAIKRAVIGGLGLAIVPRMAVEGEILSRRLAVLRVSHLSLARPIFEVWDGRKPRGKISRAFHCVLEHAARGTLPPRRHTGAGQR